MLRKLIYSLLITLVLAIPASLGVYRQSLKALLKTLPSSSAYKIYNNYKNYKPVLSESVKNPKTKEVEVAARVGGYILNSLTGWTSPFAEVTLTSQGLARKTIADNKGFFAFYYIPVPENLGELCLISQDVNQLPSFPNCLAPPAKNMNLDIKDVLLSPTISLDGAEIPTGTTAKASGMTFPDSEVEVYFFSENRFFLKAFLDQIRLISPIGLISPSPAYAFSLPSYKVRSNSNGYFEFSLPATSPANNRVFATSRFSDSLDPGSQARSDPGSEQGYETVKTEKRSPKSNTLAFRSLGILGIFLAFLKEFFRQAGIFFGSLKNNPSRIILIELGILLGLALAIFLKKFRGKLKEIKGF